MAELDGVAVRVTGVDAHTELMIHFGNGVSMCAPIGATIIEKFTRRRVVRKVVHPAGQASSFVDVGGVAVCPLSIVQISECNHSVRAGVVKDMT